MKTKQLGILFFGILLLAALEHSYSAPIKKIRVRGGGPNGYNYVSVTYGLLIDRLVCEDPGINKCKGLGYSFRGYNGIVKSEIEFIDFITEQIKNDKRSGKVLNPSGFLIEWNSINTGSGDISFEATITEYEALPTELKQRIINEIQ